ncbi:MAG TPA: acetyltransferase [Burkholderiales bacterium]|jgi:hypothetical protein|nr:acetyltransferase [Burkholderiales bacterium]
MRFYDIFNGDADGLCALQQLRLAKPQDAELVTGVKRDNRLLAHVNPGPGDQVTVLDIGLDGNRQDLLRILGAGAHCRYFDHHHAGQIPAHPLLETHIDTSPGTCTSLIVNAWLGGRHQAWAVVAAFGDNLAHAAVEAAAPLALRAPDLDALRELGECLNYNAYGETLDDLHFHPATLFRRLQAYDDPLEFAAKSAEFDRLRRALEDDWARARDVPVHPLGSRSAAVILPEEKWSRRICGLLANELASHDPSRAHAVLTRRGDAYVVSLRAPREAGPGIDVVARQFGGNGRGRAAGIELLPHARLDELFQALREAYDPPRRNA